MPGAEVPPAGDDIGGAPEPAAPDPYARARARSEALRAELEPLGETERPLGIKLAVALAAVIGAANLVGALLAIAGAGAGVKPAAGLAFAGIMAALAGAMWGRSYLAVLAFEALLALSMLYAAVSLAFASNLAGVALGVGVIVVCAPVFWLLVRVMARLQVPPR